MWGNIPIFFLHHCFLTGQIFESANMTWFGLVGYWICQYDMVWTGQIFESANMTWFGMVEDLNRQTWHGLDWSNIWTIWHDMVWTGGLKSPDAHACTQEGYQTQVAGAVLLLTQSGARQLGWSANQSLWSSGMYYPYWEEISVSVGKQVISLLDTGDLLRDIPMTGQLTFLWMPMMSGSKDHVIITMII